MTKPLQERSVEELIASLTDIFSERAVEEVAAELKRRNELMEEALEIMHDNKQDYMTRNKLGIASDQHDIQLARAALKANRGEV